MVVSSLTWGLGASSCSFGKAACTLTGGALSPATPDPVLCDAEDWAQGPVHASRTVHQLPCISSLLKVHQFCYCFQRNKVFWFHCCFLFFSHEKPILDSFWTEALQIPCSYWRPGSFLRIDRCQFAVCLQDPQCLNGAGPHPNAEVLGLGLLPMLSAGFGEWLPAALCSSSSLCSTLRLKALSYLNKRC